MKRSTWTSDLHWVREGQQDRGRKTKAALLDAAEELFVEHGANGATIADIAAAAGCSIGAFYHHYRDKRAIQFALFERYGTHFEETNRVALDPNRWVGAKAGDVLYGFVQLSLDRERSDPSSRLAGAALAEAEPDLHQKMVKLRVKRDNGIRALLLERVDEIGHPDPETAVVFVLDQLGSMLRTRLHEPQMPSRFAVRPDEEFLREAMLSTCAYLQIELPSDLG